MVENKVTKILGRIEADLVLDVATGNGEFIHYIDQFRNYRKIVAIDIESRSSEILRKRFPDHNLEFIRTDANDLDFPSENFDAVCLAHSLHHFEKPEQILGKLKTVLKTNGYFIIQEMYRDGLNAAQQSHVKLHHWAAKLDELKGKTHRQTYTKAEIKKMIAQIALRELKIIEHTYPIKDIYDEKMISQYLQIVDRVIAKLDAKHTELINEGKSIKEYIRENGYAPADCLFFVGRK